MPHKFKRVFPLKIGFWCNESGKREQEWLSNNWIVIKKFMPIDEKDELGKAKLGLRAMVLALIYQDFCYRAWNFESEQRYDIENWAKELDINKKTLISLAKVRGDKITYKKLADDTDLFAETLLNMANELREEVLDILCPSNNFWELIEELSRINTQDEHLDPNVLEGIVAWFSEKCYPVQ